MVTGIVAAVDSWQRRHPIGGLPIAVGKKFGEDRASSLAVLSLAVKFHFLPIYQR